MPLEESREFLMLAIQMADVGATIDNAKLWFQDLKTWEAEETFERAFLDGRMTARIFDPTKSATQIDVRVAQQKITLDTGHKGIARRLNPDNFTQKKKNELGLHDLSTALLRPSALISKQLFLKPGTPAVLFVLLPQPEDLRVFALFAAMAKTDPSSPLYALYVTMRAQITRIKYGADYDMHCGFAIYAKTKRGTNTPDGKIHVRYGMASIQGGHFATQILTKRVADALDYKEKIGKSARASEANNEVTLALRSHMGPFPVVGVPKGDGFLLFRLHADERLDPTPLGKLTDNGKATGV